MAFDHYKQQVMEKVTVALAPLSFDKSFNSSLISALIDSLRVLSFSLFSQQQVF